ncbi:hypothetical protein BCR32DRAFT_328678 [Anaeromyces robustus]|jgi:serpin B|uniref:CBM10 domain-containing protein n=1 Tax=Anaeromyces robustus TaxID=1754192 RepID=A0A1Y1WX68_9FUNG|nr:hypothetical protein BCR32DRAFT_328678 [Anaeromyces robustus]|eukprot:ORX78042.1 hypothetical protein BCR32DRAFT_328678 [Anaeromyces robustus]
MNNLTLFILGLVLYTPACFSKNSNPGGEKKCFSQKLNPSYPCCEGDVVVYVDKDGEWGVENGNWCGIGGVIDSCFSVALGYPCCESSCNVYYTDNDGEWGVENGNWCGLKDSCNSPTDLVLKDPSFDFAFLKMENKKKNMLYSPLSIEYALKMLQEGANGNTYSEINKIVGNEELPKYISLDKNLSLANGLFIRNTYSEYVKPSYVSTLRDKFYAEVVEDEFNDASNVNEWIEDKTLGIIKDMLRDDIVQNPRTSLILVNALAMDMKWAYPFRDESTHGRTFYKENGQEIEATTLSTTISANGVSYYKDDDLTVLTMDLKKYSEFQFEFVAIMPKNENLSSFVEKVTREQIDEIDEKLISSYDERDGIYIRIPKFKFQYDLELKKDLINLGVNDAFSPIKADLKKIADPEDPDKKLYVGDALHKADIEFSEEGIKAAAVTVIIIMAAGAAPGPRREPQPVNVIIDKPFMFMIRDKNTKNIWFTGTVYEPNLWEDDWEAYEPSYGY